MSAFCPWPSRVASLKATEWFRRRLMSNINCSATNVPYIAVLRRAILWAFNGSTLARVRILAQEVHLCSQRAEFISLVEREANKSAACPLIIASAVMESVSTVSSQQNEKPRRSLKSCAAGSGRNAHTRILDCFFAVCAHGGCLAGLKITAANGFFVINS